MKILLATPCYGGLLTTQYLGSILETYIKAALENIQIMVYIMDNESLVPRARCRAATYALENKFDKLFFIDADIGWKWDDFRTLIQSERKIVGGTYPVKAYPLTLNLNVLDEHRPLYGEGKRTLRDFEKLSAESDDQGELEVKHIPTGFLSINVEVLQALRERVPQFEMLHPVTNQREVCYEFFPSGARDGKYFSEDWAFCELARAAGFQVYLNTNCIVSHTGSHVFRAGI